MGNVDTKLNFRKAIVLLGTKDQTIDASDEAFWDQFWSDHSTSIKDVFALVPDNEIRNLRHNNPANLATLCYKATERLVRAVDNSCRTQTEQTAALNCVRLMTRILPYILEDAEWADFFWSSLPAAPATSSTRSNHSLAVKSAVDVDDNATPLAQSLLNAICDLMFCPDFTVVAARRSGPDKAEELQHLDSCEYIWEAGVGFATSPARNAFLEQRRTELLKLLLCCFSETMYRPVGRADEPNKWIVYFTSAENRHALPLFTSMLNTVCAYDPVGLGVPYNHFLFSDTMEPLVEVCLQILIVTLDHDMTVHSPGVVGRMLSHPMPVVGHFEEGAHGDNLFINYLSRIHRDEDFQFVLRGISRLLNNPLAQSYLPNSTKRLHCHQELLVFFWKLCDYNKKFLYYVLKSSDVLEVLVPILYHLNDSRADQSRVGLMHIGVFILLMLSGERNFGVRLNKPYTATVPMDIPVFTGSHADLLVTVFHKIIATGHQRLQPLFDCLLTVLVNVSPYLKTLSMVAAIKLLHLLEAFSTPWFLFTAPSNHHLVFFLLEIFNNIIQYQFDGNSNLVYTIIRKRHVFHALANLPADLHGISRCLSSRGAKAERHRPAGAGASSSGTTTGNRQAAGSSHRKTAIESRAAYGPSSTASMSSMEALGAQSAGGRHRPEERAGDLGDRRRPPNVVDRGSVAESTASSSADDADARSDAGDISMEGSRPAQPAEPGTLNVSLLDTPGLHAMTEPEAANSAAAAHATLATTVDGDGHVRQASPVLDAFAAFGADDEETSRTLGEAGRTAAEDTSAAAAAAAADDDEADSEEVPATVAVGQGGSPLHRAVAHRGSIRVTPSQSLAHSSSQWSPSPEWVASWRAKLPLQTIMRLLQVLVPQVEKICIDKGLTDESEILKFLQHGTLVGLLPVPHPILIRKYQANSGTTAWFRTYLWGVIYLRNVEPAIFYDTEVKLFEIQRV